MPALSIALKEGTKCPHSGHKMPSKGIKCPQRAYCARSCRLLLLSAIFYFFLVSQCSWVIVGTFLFMIHYLSLVAPLSVI